MPTTFYGPQAFTAGTFSASSSFKTTSFGGSDTPFTGYPEVAAGEHITTVNGDGPLGERVVDAFGGAGWSASGFTALKFGPESSPAGFFDVTNGLVWEWDQYFSSAALTDCFLGQIGVLVTKMETDADGGLFTGDSVIWLGFEQTSGANFFYDLYFRDGGSAAHYSSAVDVADNAWHRIKIQLKPGTVSGPLSGNYYPRNADGYLIISVDGVAIYSFTNLALNIPVFSGVTTTPNLLYGFWHGFAGMLGKFTNDYLYQTESAVSTTTPEPVLVDSTPPECCDSGGQASPTPGAVLPLWDPTWIKECAGGGTVPLAPDNIHPESWIS